MHARQRLAAAFILGASLMGLGRSSQAELPPGAYEELLKNAQDVVDLRIDNVKQTDESTGDMQHFVCEASVLGVERSKGGLKKGDKIGFRSYVVTDAARQRGWAGPKSPPRLQAGWTGRVFLNAAREGNVYDLAAYGRSFEPLGAQRPGELPAPPSVAPPRLGVNVRAAAAGGLEILGAGRRTLADKLGLRSGDRLVEINGTPVNALADIPAALAKHADRLEVKFVRDGETIELTLKR